MKRIITFLLVVIIVSGLNAQDIVNKGIYKAKFSNALHAPRWVSYTLVYKEKACDRGEQGFKFSNDEIELACGNEKDDYDGTGYHMGHLANARDFAYDCDAEEKTFRFYNCLHQKPNLNTGVWKVYENKARKWAKEKGKLYIVCGGYYGSKRIGKNKVAVPLNCWKVIQVVKTKEVLFSGWFTNTDHATVKEMSPEEIGDKLGSTIVLLR